jgi:hypothetical protein
LQRYSGEAVPRAGSFISGRDDHPQEPGFGIPGRRDPAQHTALPDAAAELGLHRGDARQAPRGAGRAEKGTGDRSQRKPSEAAVVEAPRMAIVAISKSFPPIRLPAAKLGSGGINGSTICAVAEPPTDPRP